MCGIVIVDPKSVTILRQAYARLTISMTVLWFGVIQLPVVRSLTPQSIRLGGALSVAIHEFSAVAPRSFFAHFG